MRIYTGFLSALRELCKWKKEVSIVLVHQFSRSSCSKVAAEKRMFARKSTLNEFYQKDQPSDEAYFLQITIFIIQICKLHFKSFPQSQRWSTIGPSGHAFIFEEALFFCFIKIIIEVSLMLCVATQMISLVETRTCVPKWEDCGKVLIGLHGFYGVERGMTNG